MQFTYKQKKPNSLQLLSHQIIVENEIPELDTFEEFCSNIPDQENQEINFSKQSHQKTLSQNSKRTETNSSNHQQSKKSNSKINNKKIDTNVEYLEFVEYEPSSVIEKSNIQRKDSKQFYEKKEFNNNDPMAEPPAPQNKNTQNFNFPQKGGGFMSLKKQLCIKPQLNSVNQSNSEQTLVKLQSSDKKIDSKLEEELRFQIKLLQNEKTRFEQRFVELSQYTQKLEIQLAEYKEKMINLYQENLQLQQKKYSSDLNTLVETSHLKNQPKFSVNDKLEFLIQKLNIKCSENAKLQYELVKLQNNVELIETQKIVNNQFFLDTGKIQNNHSPMPHSQNRGQSLSKDSRTSLLTQYKQPLNISINQQESKNIINLSNMISPLQKCAKLISQKQSFAKNSTYQEDMLQQKLRRMK